MPQDTQLHKACYEGNNNVVLALLNEKADESDPNARGAQDRTPLHRAAGAGHVEVVGTLLSFNADINAADKIGRTPLHWAALSGHHKTIKALVASPQLNINAKALNGWTALHAAASGNHTEAIQTLLEADIDATITDDNGQLAFQVAAEAGFKPSSKLKEACCPKNSAEKKKRKWFSKVLPAPKNTLHRELSLPALDELAVQLKAALLFDEQFAEYQEIQLKKSQAVQFDRTLEVGVQDAKEFSSHPDTFCIVDCQGLKRKTPIVEKSTSPFFGETFEFHLHEPFRQFSVSIWQDFSTASSGSNLKGPQLLGAAFLRPGDILRSKDAKLSTGVENWYQLFSFGQKKKNISSLVLQRRRTSSTSQDTPISVEHELTDAEEKAILEIDSLLNLNEAPNSPLEPQAQHSTRPASYSDVPPHMGDGIIQIAYSPALKESSSSCILSIYGTRLLTVSVPSQIRFNVVPDVTFSAAEHAVFDIVLLRTDEPRSRSGSTLFGATGSSAVHSLLDRAKLPVGRVMSFKW